MIVTRHVPDALQEFILRCIFNTLLLIMVAFPLFGIEGNLPITVAIVVILDLANRGFTWLWSQ